MTIYMYDSETFFKTKFETLEALWENHSKFANEDKLQKMHLDSFSFHTDTYYYTDNMGHTTLIIEDKRDSMLHSSHIMCAFRELLKRTSESDEKADIISYMKKLLGELE